MRLRLTPPDSALPSPARPPARPRAAPCFQCAPATWSGCGGGWEVTVLGRALAVPPRPQGTRVFPERRGDPRARPSGRREALAEELANGKRGRQHNVEWLQNVNIAQQRAEPRAAPRSSVPARNHSEPAPPALRCTLRESISSPPTQIGNVPAS
ncbi:uncharacterized protein LOC106999862 [Macaca mulatta]